LPELRHGAHIGRSAILHVSGRRKHDGFNAGDRKLTLETKRPRPRLFMTSSMSFLIGSIRRLEPKS